MSPDKIIVAIAGVLSLLFVYWFFFMKKETAVEAAGSINITVKGGYNPSNISIPVGKTTKLNFMREDTNNCLEEVVFADFKIRKYLPINERTSVEITPKKPGEFGFSCGMGMFHGKLIAK